MFKTLITPHEFFKRRQLQPDILQQLKKGTVSEKTLQVLWEGNDIQFLTNLMMKFDLILPLDSANGEQTYLIPCMLPPLNINIYETEPFQKMELTYSTIHNAGVGDTLPDWNFPQTAV